MRMPEDPVLVPERIRSSQDSRSYSVRPFSPEEVPDLSERWTHLAELGRTDPLFTSWQWLTTWWDLFGRPSGAEWAGLAAYDDRGRLAGLCPLFSRSGRLRGLLPVRRLEYLGGHWRGPFTVLTQQCDLISDFHDTPGFAGALAAALAARTDWDELVISAMPSNSHTIEPLVRAARDRGWFVRLTQAPPSMLIRLEGGFEQFKMSLGSKTRRRVFHQRKRLEALGRVDHRAVDKDEFTEALGLLNTFRRTRRESPPLPEGAVLFHRTVIQQLGEHARLRLTYLTLDDRPISVNYAIQVRDRAYGIQLGFDSTVDSKLSLGMIHLGYALEAVARDGVVVYDLMSGQRHNKGWKRHLANDQAPMVNLQLVRSKPLAWLYRFHAPGQSRAPHTSAPDT